VLIGSQAGREDESTRPEQAVCSWPERAFLSWGDLVRAAANKGNLTELERHAVRWPQ
jgi:hypothetical protein